MRLSSLLAPLRSTLRRGRHHEARSPHRTGSTRTRLDVEALESRWLPSYFFTDLIPYSVNPGATGVSDHGHVVGTKTVVLPNGWTAGHAYLWTPLRPNGTEGGLADLGTLGGLQSTAFGVNSAGAVVGSSEYDPGFVHTHAFLWQGGAMTDLGTFGGPSSVAQDVNDAGVAVGWAETEGGDRHAFAYQGGVMTDLGTLPGRPSSAAVAVNESGQVAGTSGTAFVWDAVSGLRDLGSLPGYPVSSAAGINDSGQVVGTAYTGTYDANGVAVSQAFVWQDGVMTSLGTLPGYSFTVAAGINDAGVVVGWAVSSSGYRTAFRWQDGVMTALQDSPAPGGRYLTQATAVNDYGQVVGEYVWSSNWVSGTAPFLLTPEAVPPPGPSLSVDDVRVTEGHAGTYAATFTVTLSQPSDRVVTVSYCTAGGTATTGSDYQSASGTLTFAPGETKKTITVPVYGDRLAEPDETFFVSLGGATNATIADGQGVGSIVDDEPRIGINDVIKYEGKKGQTVLFVFTVTLSAAYDQVVTLSYTTVSGTAKASDKDYVVRAGTLTFAPGETTKAITIEVKGDTRREADETFYLDLFDNSSNALFTKNRGVGTILNDD
jgi:probable HAF family extracellular repeat protein